MLSISSVASTFSLSVRHCQHLLLPSILPSLTLSSSRLASSSSSSSLPPHAARRASASSFSKIATWKSQEPRLTPADARDERGGYIQSSLSVSHGYTLAVYQWDPTCGRANAKGVVFILHGVIGHALFSVLKCDELNHRTQLSGSIVAKLLDLDLVVIAHDHPGHGRSSGLHAFVESHDHLRDAAIDVIHEFEKEEELKGKKRMMLGESMGGTTAIRVCAACPQLVDGYILISPAVRPPDNMFGTYGRILKFLAPLLGWLVPYLPVLKLPPSPDAGIREACERDGLLYRGALRARMGVEFLRVYSEINDEAEQLWFKSVVIFVGGRDEIVSPSGIGSFVERVQSEDKSMFVYDAGHEVLREKGCEIAVEQLVKWVSERV